MALDKCDFHDILIIGKKGSTSLSSTEEILDVFYGDIEQKTKIVTNKYGIEAFLPQNVVKGFDGFHTFDLYGGLHLEEIVCSEYKPLKNREDDYAPD